MKDHLYLATSTVDLGTAARAANAESGSDTRPAGDESGSAPGSSGQQATAVAAARVQPNGAAAVATAPPAPVEYESEWLSLQHAWTEVLPAWRMLHSQFAPQEMASEPEWCRATEAAQPGSIFLVVLRAAGTVVGVVPMQLKRAALDCQIGELNLWRFCPRVLTLMGGQPCLPEEEVAYAAWYACLIRRRSQFDLLRFTAETDSSLWRFLRCSALPGQALTVHPPEMPVQRQMIAMPAGMDEYMQKFSAKSRKNRMRELRLLHQRGELNLELISRAEQIEIFLREASAISARTYQHRMLRVGLRTPATLRARLEAAAAQGWLRSYLLRCDGAAIAYMLGYHYADRYLYTHVGFDPAWVAYSTGTMLQLLVLDEMFRRDTPKVFDFGSDGPQQAYFGNDRTEECRIQVFRRTAYAAGIYASLDLCWRINAAGGKLASQLGCKPQINRVLRWLTRS